MSDKLIYRLEFTGSEKLLCTNKELLSKTCI